MTDRESPMDPIDWGPDADALFDNRFARWGRRWSLVGVIALAVGISTATLTELVVEGILLSTIVGTLALIFGFAFWVTGRGAQSQLDRVRSGAVLARWSIDRDRWMAWFTERQAKSRMASVIGGGITLFVGLLVAGLAWDDGYDEGARTIAVIAVCSAVAVALIIQAHRARPPRASRRTMPVVIGHDGVLTLDVYLPWRAFGVNFVGAAVEADPATLTVVYSVRARHTTVEHILQIPVPDDRFDEAREVCARLIARHTPDAASDADASS